MKKADLLSTLFVGIDISSRQNVAVLLDFESQKPLQTLTVDNNQPSALELASRLAAFLHSRPDLPYLLVARESTSVYGVHLANYPSSCELLAPFRTRVYCLNSTAIHHYKKSSTDVGKTDSTDAFVITDFARANRITTRPWRGSQFLALQRLTRHRLHLVRALTREKAYMLSNIFLKFSELSLLDGDGHPFSNTLDAMASSVLTEFLSTEDILDMSTEALIQYFCDKRHNRFPTPENTARLLQQAARNSYRLDQCLYEPLTISIASSFTLLSTYTAEIKVADCQAKCNFFK